MEILRSGTLYLRALEPKCEYAPSSFGGRDSVFIRKVRRRLCRAASSPVLRARAPDIYKGTDAHPVTYSKQTGDTKTAGVVVYPIPQFGLYYNQSSNYASVGSAANRDQFGDRLPPSKSMGRDYGIKLPLFKCKLFHTLNRYEVIQKDVANSNLKNGIGGRFSPLAPLLAISRVL